MAWQIGIDEAGYGPNLGPLVMTLVGCRAPTPQTDLWDHWKSALRRPGERADRRPLIADSKKVYSSARGLAALEHGVLAVTGAAATLHDLVARLSVDYVDDLCAEAWYTGTTALPMICDADRIVATRERLRGADPAEVVCRTLVVATPRFNDATERWDSKAALLGIGLGLLARAALQQMAEGPMHFVLDKHGGRDRYAALLQEIFREGRVMIDGESRERSEYRVEGLGRPVRVTVVPRADDGHFAVALASMVSKYLRETLMAEFNAFWQRQLPGLAPTAGYPVDAVRYMDAIRPLLAGLGLTERQVWRCR